MTLDGVHRPPDSYRPSREHPAPGTSGEMYLKIAYLLSQGSSAVIAARVADFLGVSRSSASAALRRLENQRFIRFDRQRVLHLTPRGRATARSMVRRHRLFETWLIDSLGVRWSDAFDEACRLEHAISGDIEQQLYEALGRPERCPHGNPIDPDASSLGQPLAEMPNGAVAVVLEIGFPVEFLPEHLAYLEAKGVVPGARLTVQAQLPGGTGVESRVGDKPVFIAADTVQAIRAKLTP